MHSFILQEARRGDEEALKMMFEIQRGGCQATRAEGGVHCAKAGMYAKWAGQRIYNNWHMEEYGSPPMPQEKKPKTARRTQTKSMTRWSKKELVAKVQELETQLAEVIEEMHISSNEACVANVCLSNIGLNVCCILSAPVFCVHFVQAHKRTCQLEDLHLDLSKVVKKHESSNPCSCLYCICCLVCSVCIVSFVLL